VSERDSERLPTLRGHGLNREALLDRLGEVPQPPPEVRSWLSRASVAARLPDLLGLDQRTSYQLCVQVVRHLSSRRRTP
jgi:hypothetical protein